MSEEHMVPMWGTGELIDLGPAPEAIKAATDEELGMWYALHFKPVKETFDLVKEELLSRMMGRGQKMMPLENGQRIEVSQTMNRQVHEDAMLAIQKEIKAQYGLDVELLRVKREVKPDMRNIKKAMKLGDEVTKKIDLALFEEPGNPRLKVEGISEDQRKKILGVS